jgi:glycosyltransferase involved in cell wall biosynthesis
VLVIIRKLKRWAPTHGLGVFLSKFHSFVIIAWSGLLDDEWYRAQVDSQIASTRLRAAAHYVFHGRELGYSPHPLFEPEYFDPSEWRTSDLDPFAKYLRNHQNWASKTHPWFDGGAYLAANSPARQHRWGPLGHFVQTAGPQSQLPLAIPVRAGVTLRWDAGRDLLMRRARLYAHQEHIRGIVRITPGYNRSLERAFVQRWQNAPLPTMEPGIPLVSVVMPVWNRAQQVSAAIASVQAQTLGDWELIVVDDGSTDGSVDVVESIAAADPRIRPFRQAHSGVSKARNFGLERARGRYVAFLDADNTYRPLFLRTAVAAMFGHGWQLAYAALEMRTGDQVQYRGLEAGRELLELRNHVDINVLVAKRTLVGAVGSFDEDLRRTVDYDLILRMDVISPLHYMPFLGAIYDDNRDDPTRITNRELHWWLEVVQNKNLIDWQRAAATRVRGRVSILIPTYQNWRATQRCLEAVLTHAGEHDLEVIVLDNGSRRAVGSILEAIAAGDTRVTVIREPVTRGIGLSSNLAFAESTGEIVVFLSNATEVQVGWLGPLCRALQNPGVLAAGPLLLHRNRTIQCAGEVFPVHATFPVRFLANHPAEDALAIGQSFDVSVVTSAALAMRASDLVMLRGFDPIYRNGWEDVDLCLRLGKLRPGTLAVVTDSVVVHHEGKTRGRRKESPASRKVFRERWSGRVPQGDDHLWRAAGFEVAHYRVDRTPAVKRPEFVSPVVIRPLRQVSEGSAKGLPAFRWAIKIAAPAGEAGQRWGDRHFARALSAALRRLGQSVVVDSKGAHDRDTAYLDDIVLALRGLSHVTPQPGRVNLLWVISHPDLVDVDEVKAFDGVFAAGAPWAERMSEYTRFPVQVLLQCTDPDRFRPDVVAQDSGEPVLFIGNSRSVFRPIVRDALAAGVDVKIYGSGWDEYVDPRFIRDLYLSNERVAAAYRSAGVVLNDHWADMRREGFISNRIFDATASGARVVSDDVPGLAELFNGLVRTYRTADELGSLLKSPGDHFPGEEERLRLAATVRREHSFDARARTLLDAAVRLWKH